MQIVVEITLKLVLLDTLADVLAIIMLDTLADVLGVIMLKFMPVFYVFLMLEMRIIKNILIGPFTCPHLEQKEHSCNLLLCSSKTNTSSEIAKYNFR